MQLQMLGIDNGVVKLQFEGDLTSHSLLSGDPLAKILGTTAFVGPLLLGMGGVSFVDSAGIGWLLGTHRRLEAAGGKLVLHSVNPRVEQMFSLVRLSTVMYIARDEVEGGRLARSIKNGDQ
jgi:anti-anti-sigma factor